MRAIRHNLCQSRRMRATGLGLIRAMPDVSLVKLFELKGQGVIVRNLLVWGVHSHEHLQAREHGRVFLA